MNSYSYFTAPTDEFTHEFCQKCTSSYGCVCDLLIQHGHCSTCMNLPEKCLCKELSSQQSASGFRWIPTGTPGGFRLEGSVPYVNLSWSPVPQRVDSFVQQVKDMEKQLNAQRQLIDAANAVPLVAVPLVAVPSVADPSIQDRLDKHASKWQMNYFWKKACNAEGVHFTRKDHCAYPRVLAAYHRIRKEYDEADEKIMRECSAGW